MSSPTKRYLGTSFNGEPVETKVSRRNDESSEAFAARLEELIPLETWAAVNVHRTGSWTNIEAVASKEDAQAHTERQKFPGDTSYHRQAYLQLSRVTVVAEYIEVEPPAEPAHEAATDTSSEA